MYHTIINYNSNYYINNKIIIVLFNRLILLDSQLILFASFTLLSWVNFYANKER